MKRSTRTTNIPGLVKELRQVGAAFRQTSGGCWVLDSGGNSLPCHLTDAFLDADPRTLAAFLRAEAEKGEKVPALELQTA